MDIQLILDRISKLRSIVKELHSDFLSDPDNDYIYRNQINDIDFEIQYLIKQINNK